GVVCTSRNSALTHMRVSFFGNKRQLTSRPYLKSQQAHPDLERSLTQIANNVVAIYNLVSALSIFKHSFLQFTLGEVFVTRNCS
ncbi:hypothetical protein J6590_096161, partial [Homalodisca vitripennis]